MTTPRRTRLVRVPDLRAFRRAIVEASLAGDPPRVRSRLVLVPSHAAARQLGREMGVPDVAPDLVTRPELYDRLHGRLGEPPRRLTACERDVIMRAAAREVSTSPFRQLRAGLIAAMLDFYDRLRRQARTVSRFEQLVEETLSEDAEHDRGAARTLAQTRFLAEAFRAYERRLASSAACDEHALRDVLAIEPARDPVRDVVVTVGDWIADPDGLFVADFDLLTRLPGLETIDLVTTEALLSSGFHQRVHEWLPGIEEVDSVAPGLAGDRAPAPRLAVPDETPDAVVFVHRDREEELIAIARRLKAARLDHEALARAAVVFKQSLPYLYLAHTVFGRARIPYQTSDRLPLGAEPFAAALDVVFEFVETGFTRPSIVALLRTPHFRFDHGEHATAPQAVSALDRALGDKRYLGGLGALVQLHERWTAIDEGDYPGAREPLGAARAAAETLAPLLVPAPASGQLRRLVDFLHRHAAPVGDEGPVGCRLTRAQAAVVESLESLASAHAAYDDSPIAMAEVAAGVRHVIEGQTFLPEAGEAGVQLVDDQAARYGDFDELAIVGLVEGEWPDRPTRNIFYSSSLLVSLGWPTERDRRAAMETRFLELLRSPSGRVTVSTFRLDDEALVEPSAFVDEIARAGLSRVSSSAPSDVVFPDEALALDPVPLERLDPDARRWAEMRLARTPREAPAFHGQTAPIGARPWSVSALETYVGCPFKFFAQHVLRLEEEPDDEEIMDPRSQGELIHGVFETFFDRWQRAGRGAITPANLDLARALFAEVVDDRLSLLSDSEASLERTRLLGSPVAAGLGEAVFRMEAERPVAVVGRLLEHELNGEFTFTTSDGPRAVLLRGKADRVDLLADGTFRVVDYKSGWPPNKARALQLPIYGLCAEQRLDGHLGRRWTFGEAAYIAFKGPKRVVRLFTSAGERTDALASAQARLMAAVDDIARGHFPPRPDDVHRCETCSFAAVCRKDYAGDR